MYLKRFHSEGIECIAFPFLYLKIEMVAHIALSCRCAFDDILCVIIPRTHLRFATCRFCISFCLAESAICLTKRLGYIAKIRFADFLAVILIQQHNLVACDSVALWQREDYLAIRC